MEISTADGWDSLTKYTRARIALGRAGGSFRTPTLLQFRLLHARARDAVNKEFDECSVETAIRDAGLKTIRLETLARDRQSFLKRPDLGRQLASASRQILLDNLNSWGRRDLAVIVSDGLSPLAAEAQAPSLLAALLPNLSRAGWSIFPVFIAPFARVKLQDQVGELLHARHSLMLLGERPGLGSPDSLGAYFTFNPSANRTDADRNCVSNIRAEGLPPARAAQKLFQLLDLSAQLQLSGVNLKERAPSLPP